MKLFTMPRGYTTSKFSGIFLLLQISLDLIGRVVMLEINWLLEEGRLQIYK